MQPSPAALIGPTCLAAAVLLSACGPKPPAAPSPQGETAEATPAAAGAAGPPPSCAGRKLEITGVCADAHPGRFRAINAGAATYSPKCFWYTDQVMLDDKTALVFRTQDCKAEGWDNHVYGYSDGRVKTGAASTPYAIDQVILTLFPIPPGKTAEAVAAATLATAPQAERGRCKPKPHKSAEVAGDTFLLAPDDAFQKEIDARNEVVEACGSYGTGDNASVWEARKGYAFFHHLRQEPGYWDPASYTFYRKDAAGNWLKSDE